jgi:hypothetical protein
MRMRRMRRLTWTDLDSPDSPKLKRRTKFRSSSGAPANIPVLLSREWQMQRNP